MKHSPYWEANRSSAIQEIPRILWNQKFYTKSSQQEVIWPYHELGESNPRRTIQLL